VTAGQRRTKARCATCARVLAGADVWRLYGRQRPNPRLYCAACVPLPAAEQRAHQPEPCEWCSNRVYYVVHGASRLPRRAHAFCDQSCKWAFYQQQRSEQTGAGRAERVCPGCGRAFAPPRADAVTCSARCRRRVYLDRTRPDRQRRWSLSERLAMYLAGAGGT
jgi:hypothetical protein